MLFKLTRPIVEQSAVLFASPGRRHFSRAAMLLPAAALRAPGVFKTSGCVTPILLKVSRSCRAYASHSSPHKSEQSSGLRLPYYTTEELEAMTVPDLRALLKDNGLKVSGRKADLVERVLKSVHQNHGAETSASLSTSISTPATQSSNMSANLELNSSSGSAEVTSQPRTDNTANLAQMEHKRLKILQAQESSLLEQQKEEQLAHSVTQREAQLLEQQEKEHLAKKQQEEERQVREQQENEQRLREEQEKEMKLLEQREEEARLKEQQEREKYLKVQQDRERKLKEQQERDEILREQQEKDQRLKNQQEKERKLKEQQEKDKRFKEQQEKERRQIQALQEQEHLRKQQEQQQQQQQQQQHQQQQGQQRSSTDSKDQKANTNSSEGSGDEWAREKIPLGTKAASIAVGFGVVAWFLTGKRDRRAGTQERVQEHKAYVTAENENEENEEK